MTDSKTERVARAIYKLDAYSNAYTFEQLKENIPEMHDLFLRMARAAIEECERA